MKVSEFKSPYICIEQQPEGYGVVYNAMGDYSVIFRVENPVQQWSGDKSLYEDFHSFYTNLLKLFGNGYILQKQDLFFRKKYHHVCDNTDFLDNEYFKLFEGREYTETETYLILTCEVKKSFFSYDKEAWDTFRSNVSRLLQMFDANGYAITALDESQCNDYLHNYCTINFNKGEVAFDNIKATRKKFWGPRGAGDVTGGCGQRGCPKRNRMLPYRRDRGFYHASGFVLVPPFRSGGGYTDL